MNKKIKNREYMRKWSKEHRIESRQRANDQYKKIVANPIRWAKRQATRAIYRIKNKAKELEKHKKYLINQRKTNPTARIAHNTRTRLWGALKRKVSSKLCGTEELLGCSIKELKIHIEKQFKNGMAWSNYGRCGWHIDHIVPLAQFDLLKIEHQKLAFHYTNLQPLWAKDNLRKGDGRRNNKIHRIK